MNAEPEKKDVPKPTGRRYKSTEDLIEGEGLGPEVKKAYEEIKNLPKTAEELDRRFDAGEDLESLGFELDKGVIEDGPHP